MPSKIKLPASSKYLTTEIGIKYIGNMLKDIDIRLYLEYLKMLKGKIKFTDKYDVEKSVCISEVVLGVTNDVEIKVPNIRNGIDMFATSHELGHGIKSFTKVNNERYLHFNSIYDETISILFGRLCLERYINDFGYDIFVQQFERLNIKNAIKCLEQIKVVIPKYIERQEILDNTVPKEIKNPRYDDRKYYSFVREVEELIELIYKLISYPIGISLANVYDNFDKVQKGEYLEFVSKYLLNNKHIDFEMILGYFDIPFDADFYIRNFKEYVDRFEEQDKKILVFGRSK